MALTARKPEGFPEPGGVIVTTIRANCPNCGDVHLKASNLTIRVCADDEVGSYTFDCPTCSVPVAKEASRRIIDLLVSTGVPMEVWKLPAEIFETHEGPPISPDDLLDFHLELSRDGWFEELSVMVRKSMPR